MQIRFQNSPLETSKMSTDELRSNFLLQDLANFGRGLSFSAGSAYNTLIGASAPVSPMPWQGQLSGTNGSRII